MGPVTTSNHFQIDSQTTSPTRRVTLNFNTMRAQADTEGGHKVRGYPLMLLLL